MSKSAIRKVFLRKRKTLTDVEFDARNRGIHLNFQKHIQIADMEKVHVFLPIEKNREVNTWPIINSLLEANGQVILSKSNTSLNEMHHYVYHDGIELKQNKWGIPEPSHGELVDDTEIDTILVPLIICDKLGHRIGYGKGYYDNFLSKCRKDVRKIGVSLAPLVDKIDCMEPFDIALDYCISPFGIYEFN